MWTVICYLIKTAKYVRLIDGFMGKTSLDVFKGLGIRTVAVVRMPLQVHAAKNGRTMNLTSIPKEGKKKTKELIMRWAYDIGGQVRDGKNVMVFYP